jgi:AcrR family transcriptional regulator
MTTKQVAMAMALRQDPPTTAADICQTLGVSRATFYRYVSRPGT